MPQQARITGKVEYREGDGPLIVIRRGPIEVHLSELDATLSWTDPDTHGSTAMPVADFKRYVDSGAIELD